MAPPRLQAWLKPMRVLPPLRQLHCACKHVRHCLCPLARRQFSATGRMRYREFATPVPADGPVQRAAAVADNLVALVRMGHHS